MSIQKILLRVYAILDVLLALVAIIIQTIIIVHHGDCAYSKMGTGVWAGITLLVTAAVLLAISFKKAGRVQEWGAVWCGLSLMASLVQAGIGAGVIYQIFSLQFFDRGSQANFIPYGGNLGQWLDQLLLHFGTKFVNQVMYYAQIRLCYNFPLQDFFGANRKAMEAVLLVCGVIAIIVNVASMVALRNSTSKPIIVIQQPRSAQQQPRSAQQTPQSSQL